MNAPTSMLPPPPHRVRTSVFTRATFLVVLWAGMTALMGWYVLAVLPQQVSEIRREKELWNRGAPAIDGSYEGEVSTNRFVFSTFRLTVHYTDQNNFDHTGKLEFDSLGGNLDDKTPGEIRYDPDHPDQFVLSKALDMSGTRWASVAFFGVVCVGIVALFGWLALRTVKDVRRTMACARDGVAVEVEIVSASVPDRYGTVRYAYRVAGGPTTPTVHKSVLQKRAVMRAGGDVKRAMAMQSRTEPAAVVLLAADGHPFELPPEVRARL
jgi:hypothetical protein